MDVAPSNTPHAIVTPTIIAHAFIMLTDVTPTIVACAIAIPNFVIKAIITCFNLVLLSLSMTSSLVLA